MALNFASVAVEIGLHRFYAAGMKLRNQLRLRLSRAGVMKGRRHEIRRWAVHPRFIGEECAYVSLSFGSLLLKVHTNFTLHEFELSCQMIFRLCFKLLTGLLHLGGISLLERLFFGLVSFCKFLHSPFVVVLELLLLAATLKRKLVHTC